MSRMQPTTSTLPAPSIDDQDQAQATSDQEQAQVTDEQAQATDPTAALTAALDAAAAATDPITGTVPLADVAAVSTAVKALRGNARLSAVTDWTVQAFSAGQYEPVQISAVVAVAQAPSSTSQPKEQTPEHVTLAYRLAILEQAADLLMAEAGDQVAEQAIEYQTSDSFELPDSMAARAAKVAKSAKVGTGPRKGGSGGHDGPRADLVALIIDAVTTLADDAVATFADVKSHVAAAGGSKGGAIDNRWSALAVAGQDGDGVEMTSATRRLFEAGIRAIDLDNDQGGTDKVWMLV